MNPNTVLAVTIIVYFLVPPLLIARGTGVPPGYVLLGLGFGLLF